MIEFRDVGLQFGDRPVLRDVSLSLPKGSFHFLTGPSGAGKTTLLRLAYFELAPDRGSVSLFGGEAGRPDRDAIAALRRRMGVVHQDCRFIDHLSLADNVTLPLVAAGRDPGTARADLEELLGWVGLGHVADRLPPELSGGERQRAALARAIIMSPEIILADEPTGNLDWDMSMRLLDLLVELNALGMTILCATHDLHLIRQAKSRVSARVLRLRDGDVQLAGAEL